MLRTQASKPTHIDNTPENELTSILSSSPYPTTASLDGSPAGGELGSSMEALDEAALGTGRNRFTLSHSSSTGTSRINDGVVEVVVYSASAAAAETVGLV
jgi:hypothetical protein